MDMTDPLVFQLFRKTCAQTRQLYSEGDEIKYWKPETWTSLLNSLLVLGFPVIAEWLQKRLVSFNEYTWNDLEILMTDGYLLTIPGCRPYAKIADAWVYTLMNRDWRNESEIKRRMYTYMRAVLMLEQGTG